MAAAHAAAVSPQEASQVLWAALRSRLPQPLLREAIKDKAQRDQKSREKNADVGVGLAAGRKLALGLEGKTGYHVDALLGGISRTVDGGVLA